MITAIVILLITTIVSSGAAYLGFSKSLQLQDKLDKVTEAIDQSLDVLDEHYRNVDKKSQLEVMSDDPIIRDLVSDIRGARDAVLVVAAVMNDSVSDEETQEPTST